MRPPLLDPLFAPVTTLSGIGPRTAPLFHRVLQAPDTGARIIDLLFHLPIGVIDRRLAPSLIEAPFDAPVSIKVKVAAHRPSQATRGRQPHRVLAEDETGDVELVFFNPRPGQLQSMLPVGATRYLSGRLELFDGLRQMVHPDRIMDERQFAEMPPFEAVYPQTEGLTSRMIAKVMQGALQRLPVMPEWLDTGLLAKKNWPSFKEAIESLHHPSSPKILGEHSPAHERLAFDEMLASQVAIALVRARSQRLPGRPTIGTGSIDAKMRNAIPFALTAAQERSLVEIRTDLASDKRMVRLLQGDVGSGKTVVAALAMATAAEAGRQSALMAPTEILAQQHFARIADLCTKAGIRAALLTGRDKGRERQAKLDALASGDIQVMVGTHALFQDDVVFRDLAFVVVDEQHRFGVHQRLALSAKGKAVDLLVMTATPIPRTLVLTFFGDMEVSVLDEKPPGRLPIDTRSVNLERLDDVIAAAGRAINAGDQIYWVCPLVSESEVLDVAAAEQRFAELQKAFGSKVGLVHGKMAGADKDRVIESFAKGELRLLVSTTVIEVGVDVPNASIMVIEHAERFGLAQLHQLRGRVGRGAKASRCILLFKAPLSEAGQARLSIMRETEDGFRISEEDLKLRGEGDVLGSKQSGMPGFRIADPIAQSALMAMARDHARMIVDQDPELLGTRGRPMRLLLYLFDRDTAVRTLSAG